jgi:pre-mRNA-splicing factor RBM22/SLT11
MSVSAGDDFPQLCETCLGPNPYIRMIKLPMGHKLCKISNLAYQAFRWSPAGGRQKETIISFPVAKERNICQTCLNDMQYGLPVGVRDKILAETGREVSLAPQSVVGAAYHYSHTDTKSDEISDALTIKNTAPEAHQLARLAQARAAIERKSATSFRNLPKLCSFWVAGTCTRCVKKLCQFRPCCGIDSFAFPELASTHKDLNDALINRLKEIGPIEVMKTLDNNTRKALQDSSRGVNRDDAIRSRVAGSDDLTNKLINKMNNNNNSNSNNNKKRSNASNPPDDISIKTLWLGNLPENIDENELKSCIYPGGQITDMHIARKAKCAFIEYETRELAENAAKMLYGTCTVRGENVSVNWAKPQPKPAAAGAGSGTNGVAKSIAAPKKRASSTSDEIDESQKKKTKK